MTKKSTYRYVPEKGSVPADPSIRELSQPDGVTFEARQWGDAWHNGWETADGYTIVQDDSGVWKYASIEDGQAEPTDQTVGVDPAPERVSAYERPSDDDPSRVQGQISAQEAAPNTGTVKFPVIMITYPDKSTTNTPSEFQDLLFGTDPSVATGPGSMKDFYNEVSYGQLTVEGTVEGWVEADNNHDYYSTFEDAKELVKEAVDKVDDQIDFSKYDNNNDGIVDQVAVIHQGRGEEESGNSNDIWSHHWQVNHSTSDGVDISGYTMQPERQFGHMATMGVYAHEFGHAFGLPDLYDTDYSSEGIGSWGLMAGGSWNSVNQLGDSPAHPCPWSRKFMGWSSPTTVTGDEIHASTTLRNSVEHNEFYQVLDPDSNADGEYFLIENAAQKGFNQGLPGEGVLIYHIIQSLRTDDNCVYWNDCNDDEDRKLVDLEAADGDADMDSGTNDGDPEDAWQSGPFYPASTPSTDYNDGTESGVTVSPISISDGVAQLTISTNTRSVFDEVWSFDLGAVPQFSTPAFDTDQLYIGGLGNKFHAIDRTTGSVTWRTNRSGALVDSSPTINGETVYVGSGGGKLYALNTGDGSIRWEFSTGSAIVSSPTVHSGVVYVGTNDGSLYAVDTSDGSEKWRYEAGDPVYSKPFVDESSVYVSTNGGRIVSLSTDGTEEWTDEVGSETGHTSPVVADSTVYFAGEKLYALDSSDGRVQWSNALDGVGTTPVIDSGTVYIGDDSGAVTAHGTDGSRGWSFSANDSITSQPVVSSGRVLVGTETGTMYALDTADGSKIATKTLPGPVRATPSVKTGITFVGDETGTLHALVSETP